MKGRHVVLYTREVFSTEYMDSYCLRARCRHGLTVSAVERATRPTKPAQRVEMWWLQSGTRKYFVLDSRRSAV